MTSPSLSSLPFIARPEDDGEAVACFCLTVDVEVGSTARVVGIDNATLVRFGRGMAGAFEKPWAVPWTVSCRLALKLLTLAMGCETRILGVQVRTRLV